MMMSTRLMRLLFLAFASFAYAEDAKPFKIRFDVGMLDGKKGESGFFVVEVFPEWAPLGAARIREIVENGVWNAARFFRVVPGFVVQWGIPGKASIAAKWREMKIKDDPVKKDVQNLKGHITFAKSGENTRTTQVFINLEDNTNLDSMGFPPFGKVVEGMDVVTRINSKHQEKPNQGEIQSNGNVYLKKEFPDLSFVKKVSFLDADGKASEL
eukprot:TRINITY_DN3114_c1_g1_i1.p1 TRINITY_DN3114_c1_g1~~TRINITY_DN3114_c1_g1_i1.p1  ORF type:complete len:212 (+),score=45.42 TRINITY_DN3114_c1_g1_i1:76-711(+)